MDKCTFVARAQGLNRIPGTGGVLDIVLSATLYPLQLYFNPYNPNTRLQRALF
jgi:hypothetical protein